MSTTIHIATLNLYGADGALVLTAISELRITTMALAASTQAKLDGLVTLITDVGAQLVTTQTAQSDALAGLTADVAALKALNQGGDDAANTAAVDAALDDVSTKLNALKVSADSLTATAQGLADLDATTTPGSIPPPNPPAEPEV